MKIKRIDRKVVAEVTKKKQKEIRIDYLYLDLNTCDRCVGTDAVLEEVIEELSPAFALAGYRIAYRKTEITGEVDAALHQFVSSPTIRVNGRDICGVVKESDCGCCGEISGTQVDCRVFEYDGKTYEIPPKAMLAEAILKNAFTVTEREKADPYAIPQNLKNFFEGKEKKNSCCCSGSCC